MSDLCKECVADFTRDGVALCPLHAQAEGMRAFIIRWADIIPPFDAAEFVRQARALLRAIEGRQTP